jgi:hypothetical protein
VIVGVALLLTVECGSRLVVLDLQRNRSHNRINIIKRLGISRNAFAEEVGGEKYIDAISLSSVICAQFPSINNITHIRRSTSYMYT